MSTAPSPQRPVLNAVQQILSAARRGEEKSLTRAQLAIVRELKRRLKR